MKEHAGYTGSDSVGCRLDYCYEGKKIVGSALVHNRSLIQAAFFQVTKMEKLAACPRLPGEWITEYINRSYEQKE